MFSILVSTNNVLIVYAFILFLHYYVVSDVPPGE
jgi:hypothetical protein